MLEGQLANRGWQFKEYAELSERIYGEINKLRSDSELWLHAIEDDKQLYQALEKQSIPEILGKAADKFMWAVAVARRHGDLFEMVFDKFPMACAYCFEEKDCGCSPNKEKKSEEEIGKLREVYREENKWFLESAMLYDFQAMFARVYGKSNARRTLEKNGLHLAQESSELAGELLRGNEQEIRFELADIVARVFALVGRCEQMSGRWYRFDDIVYERYRDGCPTCEEPKCACH